MGTVDLENVCKRARKRVGKEIPLSDKDKEQFALWLDLLNDLPTNLLGKGAIRERAAKTLVSQYLLRQRLTEHPEIEAKPVVKPIFIASMPRTGTTLLHKLLSVDERARPLCAWESLNPILTPREARKKNDPRISRARMLKRVQRVLAPAFSSIHEFDPMGPEEDTPLLVHTLASPADLVAPSRYRDWYSQLSTEELVDRFQVYRQILQLLQWERPVPENGFWALKSPIHNYHIDVLKQVFPDCKVLFIHRRMSEVIPSLCSIMSFFYGMVIDDEELSRQIPQMLVDWCDLGLKRFSTACENGASDVVIHVNYVDLVNDPQATLKRIFGEMSLEFPQSTSDAVRDYLEKNPKGKHGKHKYSAEKFGLTDDSINERFDWYHQKFQVPLP